MKKRVNYYLSEFFNDEFKKLVNRKQDFELIRTSYTKKLKTSHSQMVFNPDGIGDEMILSLINKIRNDAKKYIERNKDFCVDEPIYFVDMFEIPDDDEIIVKVDLTSAYWKFARLNNIISKETQHYFEDTFRDRDAKEKKSIRLKALGCLATRKEVEVFKNGKSVDWMIEEQPTKHLYMHICRCVDNLMRECRNECYGCIFYYWDCMFVKKQHAHEVIKFFTSKQFECKSEETRLSYDLIGTNGYITSEVDGKMYMVKANEQHKLNKYTLQ